MIESTFECKRCHGIFEKAWSDEESEEEAIALFGENIKTADVVIVCDDCYEIMKCANN